MTQEQHLDGRVRLVEYTIVSIERGNERVMPGACSRCVVDTGDTRGCNLDTWLIARYLSENEVKVPTRYLRVAHTVLGSWPKPPLHFQEEQLRRLAGIRRALLLTIGGEPDTEELPPAVPPTNRPTAPPAAWVNTQPKSPTSAWPWPISPGKAAAEPPAASPKSRGKLTDVAGLGPKSAAALRGAGISTLENLAETSVDRLLEVLESAEGNFALVEPAGWPDKARELMGKDN